MWALFELRVYLCATVWFNSHFIQLRQIQPDPSITKSPKSSSYSASVCCSLSLIFCPFLLLPPALSLSHTHTHRRCTHTSGLIFIASSSFTWHGSLNRCAPALSCLPLHPPLSLSFYSSLVFHKKYLIRRIGRTKTKTKPEIKLQGNDSVSSF